MAKIKTILRAKAQLLINEISLIKIQTTKLLFSFAIFNIRLIMLIALFCCFFDSIGENMNKSTIAEKLGKKVFIYFEQSDATSMQYTYTTKLSRILLVGEHPFFEHRVRWLPFINTLTNHFIDLAAPIFDKRFDDFIKNAKNFSQKQLQEAIQDAILLSPSIYNTKAYSASKLLNLLSKGLQDKIACINYQIKHDFKYDQQACSSVKKSGAWAIGLITLLVITNKCIDSTGIENKVSNLEFLNSCATLGLLPVSYKILKNCYKILTIRPGDYNEHLNKYEELLLFVQKLKSQLEKNGFIAFELTNGVIATLKDDQLVFN